MCHRVITITTQVRIFSMQYEYHTGLPRWLSGKEIAFNSRDAGLIPGLEDSLEEMAPVFLPEKIPWTEKLGGL